MLFVLQSKFSNFPEAEDAPKDADRQWPPEGLSDDPEPRQKDISGAEKGNEEAISKCCGQTQNAFAFDAVSILHDFEHAYYGNRTEYAAKEREGGWSPSHPKGWPERRGPGKPGFFFLLGDIAPALGKRRLGRERGEDQEKTAHHTLPRAKPLAM